MQYIRRRITVSLTGDGEKQNIECGFIRIGLLVITYYGTKTMNNGGLNTNDQF
jgi:hypothetical protein